MATGSAIDRAARAIKRANTSSPAWVQRRQQLSMHQGTLTRVDEFNNVADFQFPDPGGFIVPSVNIIRPYNSAADAQVGHVVWGVHVGTDFMILGQHLSLSGLVSM
jgi:hypothetical protein